MKALSVHLPRWCLLTLLVLMALALLAGLWVLTSRTDLGGEDFAFYWSAASLLRDGQNPYDPALMAARLRELGSTGAESGLLAWNPPLLFVLLLPLTLLPYALARLVWLLVNLAIVVGGCLMLGRLYLPAARSDLRGLLLLFAFSLPQVVVGVFMGQVTFLVFLGAVAGVYLIQKEKWFWAGAALALTVIKPHLVVLLVPYLLLVMARRRKWQGWAGLALAGALCAALLFALRPAWIGDLLGEMRIAPLHWATPTLGGLLSDLGMGEAARYLIVLLLPLPFVLALGRGRAGGMRLPQAAALLTLLTVPCTFFGWSFDQAILLLPAAQVFAWLGGLENRRARAALAFSLAGAVVVNWMLRLANVNDMLFVWYPLFLCIVYPVAWALRRNQNRSAGAAA